MTFRRTIRKKKESNTGKINHKKEIIDGIVFDSKTEANYYVYLKEQKELGEVIDFTMQQTFVLQPKYIYFNGELIVEDDIRYKDVDKERKRHNKNNPDNKINIVQGIKYIADFDVTYKDGTRKVIDVKGIKTADFILKEKMFNFRYPHLNFECVVWDTKSKSWMEFNEHKKAKKERKNKKDETTE